MCISFLMDGCRSFHSILCHLLLDSAMMDQCIITSVDSK
jgi:hypothetical protein